MGNVMSKKLSFQNHFLLLSGAYLTFFIWGVNQFKYSSNFDEYFFPRKNIDPKNLVPIIASIPLKVLLKIDVIL